MAQLNSWSQNSSALPTQEELFQQMLNAGAVPGQTPPPGVTPQPKPKVSLKMGKKAAPSPLAMGPQADPNHPVQQEQPVDPLSAASASRGTFHDPYEDLLTDEQKRDMALKNRIQFQSGPELGERYRGIEDNIPAVQQLEKGNQDYRAMIAMEAAQPESPNLSGAMALGDVLTNNKYDLRAGYKAPGDKAKELLANMDKAQDNQKDLMKDVISIANSGKSGYDNTTLLQQLHDRLTQGFKTAPPPRPSNFGVDNYHKWVTNTDKQFQDFDKQTQQINQLKQEVAAGNPIDDARIGILRASMDAHGRPNIAEVNREAGNQAAGARIMNSWDMISKGNISDENRALYTQSFNNILQYLDGERKKTADRMRQQGKVGYGLNDAQINARLPKDYVDKASGGGQAAAVPAPQTDREKEMQSLQDSNKALLQHLDDLKKSRGGK